MGAVGPAPLVGAPFVSCVRFLVPCFVAGCSWGQGSLVPVFPSGSLGALVSGLVPSFRPVPGR